MTYSRMRQVHQYLTHAGLGCFEFLYLRADLAWLVVDESLVRFWDFDFGHVG